MQKNNSCKLGTGIHLVRFACWGYTPNPQKSKSFTLRAVPINGPMLKSIVN